jgi:hypothetical protein
MKLNVGGAIAMDMADEVFVHAAVLMGMIAGSAIVVGLLDKEADAKVAVEAGMAVMLDKPLIIVAVAGVRIPDKLRAVADEIVMVDSLDLDAGAKGRIEAAVERMMERLLRSRDTAARA